MAEWALVMNVIFLLKRDSGAIAKIAHSKITHYFEIETLYFILLILIMIMIALCR